MQAAVDDSPRALVALQHAAAAAIVAVDGDGATQDRVQAAFEAMAPNTRRAYASALRTWGRWAAAQQVSGLCPPPPGSCHCSGRIEDWCEAQEALPMSGRAA